VVGLKGFACNANPLFKGEAILKILVVSDIHYPDRRADIPDLSSFIEKSDLIFATGDFTCAEVVDYLKSFKKQVVAVHGNADDPFLKTTLPENLTVEVKNVKIGLYHGSGTPIRIASRVKNIFDCQLDAYIFGHTHIPLNKLINGKLFFNPGTVSGFRSSIGMLYIDSGNIRGEIIRLSSHIMGV